MPAVTNITDQNNLVLSSRYPHAKFPYEKFNPVQSRVFEIYDEDASVLIAGATSCGKTLCAELMMAYEVRVRGGKAMYLAPMKSLTKEKIDDWTDKDHHFSDLNISVCTGDYKLTPKRKKELEEADIIIMTTEMIDAKCKNYKSENSEFLKSVGTLVCDEVHLLTVPNRGDNLEVGLMKFAQISPKARFVFLSATMPNVEEIAEWVSYELTGRKTYLLKSDYRPCPLGIHYERYWDGNKGYYDNEDSKVSTAMSIFEDHSNEKFLFFCHTIDTGKRMLKALKDGGYNAEFHFSFLEKEQRHAIEKKFKSRELDAVVATPTLAWGCYEHGSRILMNDCSLKEVENLEVGMQILAPKKSEFCSSKVVRIKDFVTERSYKVVLESGEAVKVSPDHLFMSAKLRESPRWNCVTQLSKGDFIGVPSDLGLWNSRTDIDIFWYLVGFAFGDGCLTICGKHADGKQKMVLDFCLGERNAHANLICKWFNQLFSTNYSMRDDTSGIPHLISKKRRIVDEFAKFLPIGRKNGNDDLPSEIYLSQAKIRSFLVGLFDADGGMEDHTNGNYSVGLSNISKKAIESVRSLLLGFGIRSSFGKKRVRDSVINGRLQLARRRWSYRLRIFGSNIVKFKKFMDFLHPDKSLVLDKYLKISCFDAEKDLIPARELLKHHLCCNDLSNVDFEKVTGSGLWNSLNTQDCRRNTIQKLCNKTKIQTPLNDLASQPIYWSRIKSISKSGGGTFREIEVGEPHTYVGNGVISHNCNLPARRVVIVGVHRAMDEVETYNIWQMVGRAGRVGLDDRGDAYILLPEKRAEYQQDRIIRQQNIESRLLDYVGGGVDEDGKEKPPHYKVLAFHIVSEIHHGGIKNRNDVHSWYRHSLAHFQNKSFDDDIVDTTIGLLMNRGIIREEDEQLKATAIGKVSSMFYITPFDAADLFRNFKIVFENGLQDNDLVVSMALANIDTIRGGICNKLEKEEIKSYAARIRSMFGDTTGEKIKDATIKGGYVYSCLLQGRPATNIVSMQRSLKQDFPRIKSVIEMLDSMRGKWDKKGFLDDLQSRILYGVRSHLVDLVRIPKIGKVKAEALYNAGVKSVSDFAYKEDVVRKVLNMKKIDLVIADAKNLTSGSS